MLLERLFVPSKTKAYFKSILKPIWIHAVSVGEVNSLKAFLDKIRASYPDAPVVISVITPQGKALASKLYRDKAYVFYLPVDISFIIKKTVARIKPRIFLCLETEIWPNLYFFLDKAKIPIVIFNARISDKSLPLYRLIRGALKPILDKVGFVACQDEVAKKRFLKLGLDLKRLKVTGNMKFRSIKPSQDKVKEYREKASLIKNGGLLIVAGSTHSPEEEIMVEVYKDILSQHQNIKLLICPRHVERASAVSKTIERFGFKAVRTSKLQGVKAGQKTIFVVDTTGDLLYFYSLSDLVFVGGSLARHGGHNILEPAYFSKPIVFGKFMFNFQDIASTFLKNEAAIEVKDKEELKNTMVRLVEDRNLRQDLGKRAFKILEKSEDSLQENLSIVKKFI
jgi:3-deoxy-D-manno-octulosonic-acid transferase